VTVLTTSVVTLKPGRFQDYVDNIAKPTKAAAEKTGAKNYRLLAGVMAGEQTGMLVISIEADDFASAGAAAGKAFADPVIQKAMALGDDSPMAGYQNSQWLVVPLDNGERGANRPVVQASTIQVKPERWEDFLADARKVRPMLASYGAQNSLLVVSLMGGQWTGSVVMTFEFDDLAAQGAYTDKIVADQEIARMMMPGPDSPHSGFQSSLFVEIPL
jgi:hypothetical protein